MSCLTPVYRNSYVGKDGKVHYYKPVTKEYIALPCGKCWNCLKRRRSEWVFRLCQEFKHCYTGFFVTLTYDDEHLPLTPDGVPFLEKEVIKKFWHNFRNHLGYKIKYFGVGEYGDMFGRPHYHFILFNYAGDNISLYDEMAKHWKNGNIDIRYLSERLCNYCSKYMIKDVDEDFQDSYLIAPPFFLYSKGLGKQFLDDPCTIAYLVNRTRTLISDGYRSIRIPRYYLEKMFELYNMYSPDDYLTLKTIYQQKNSRHAKKVEQTDIETYARKGMDNRAERIKSADSERSYKKRLDKEQRVSKHLKTLL